MVTKILIQDTGNKYKLKVNNTVIEDTPYEVILEILKKCYYLGSEKDVYSEFLDYNIPFILNERYIELYLAVNTDVNNMTQRRRGIIDAYEFNI